MIERKRKRIIKRVTRIRKGENKEYKSDKDFLEGFDLNENTVVLET